MINKISAVAKDLRLAGEQDLADKLLCALAALTDAKQPKADLSYTYVMRELRKNCPENVDKFQIAFKQAFEQAIDENLEDPEQIALMEAMDAVEFKDA
jgi:hypothetical protein